ncbi:hypothetical protein FA13DRAFT_1791234 [Coprinellus micaceus]|uniref:Uncharacterized protein n=1 Tax=Coprinellus micaceus TaxID=71717 RepID=A0A4Y7TCS9_COPMI|nr:hypothetical protein FA13DRAFT_1791234 [Coprinellus micaceus]
MSSAQPSDTSATHASRNPHQPVIEPNRNPQPRKTRVEKLDIQIRREQIREKENEMNKEIDMILEEKNKKIAEVAERFGKKPAALQKLADRTSTYCGQKRKSNLYNTLLKAKAQELNEGKPKGERAKRAEIHAALLNDRDAQRMRDEPKSDDAKALLAQHDTQRVVRKTGARSSNKAAAQDAGRHMAKMGLAIDEFNARTGVASFMVMTCGHVNDTVMPAFAGTAGCMEFVQEQFGVPLPEMLRKYEVFETNRDKDAHKNRLKSLRTACKQKISEGLCRIVGKKRVKMSYKNYTSDIQLRYGVQINQSWPRSVRFSKPDSNSSIAELEILHKALSEPDLEGGCKWVKLTQEELTKLAETTAPTKRKTRSDKDKKRKKRVSHSSDEESDASKERAGKKTKTQKKKNSAQKQLPPAPKSREVISDSEEEEEEEEE